MRSPAHGGVYAALAEARRLLARAEVVCVLTGAGISRASGIPTYQDLEALPAPERAWLSQAASFAHDPVPVWRRCAVQRQHHRVSQPNAAHRALAAWMREPSRYGSPPNAAITLLTQNIDGLHERAAVAAHDPDAVDRMIRLHGTLHRGRCIACQRVAALPDHILTVDGRPDLLPRCPACAGLMRPDVVWFGEQLAPAVLGAAIQAAADADVCCIIGCSLDVRPAGMLPWRAQICGAHLIEVNPAPALAAGPGITRILAPAEDALPVLLASPGAGAATRIDRRDAP